MDGSHLLHFVVLRHDGVEHPHFDLMFELEPGGKLATWRSPVWPVVRSTPPTRLADHRREYLGRQRLRYAKQRDDMRRDIAARDGSAE